jgi:hypothetical protein
MNLGMLAPAPDFRYVGVAPVKTNEAFERFRCVAGSAVVGAYFGAMVGASVSDRIASAFLGAMTGGALRVFYIHKKREITAPPLHDALPMAIVPWGVLIESESQPRALRWAAIERVDVKSKFVRHGAIDTTAFTILTIETAREKFVGRAQGDVPLDRLVAHLEAYSREASHRIALDLDGARPAPAHLIPSCESLLHAAREYVESSAAVLRLSLSGGDYRRAGSRAPSKHAIEELRGVLADRRDMSIDPRPFAAILAAEFGARELEKEIIALVQSPHPVVAAVAKAAARKLGVATSRTGCLEEVAPFMFEQDIDSLDAWVSSARA